MCYKSVVVLLLHLLFYVTVFSFQKFRLFLKSCIFLESSIQTTQQQTTQQQTTQQQTTALQTTQQQTTSQQTTQQQTTQQQTTQQQTTEQQIQTTQMQIQTTQQQPANSIIQGNSSSSNAALIGGIGGAILLVLLLILVLFVSKKRGQQKEEPTKKLELVAKELEGIQIQEKVREGITGEVYKGTWIGTAVFLKKLKDAEVTQSLFLESEKFSKLKHPNISKNIQRKCLLLLLLFLF
jgi:ATP-dependent Zn protease